MIKIIKVIGVRGWFVMSKCNKIRLLKFFRNRFYLGGWMGEEEVDFISKV